MLRGVNGKEAWEESQTVVVIDIAFLFLHTTAPDAAFDCAEQSSYTYTQTILRSLTCHCIISAVDVAYHQPGSWASEVMFYLLGLRYVLPPIGSSGQETAPRTRDPYGDKVGQNQGTWLNLAHHHHHTTTL